MDNSKEQHDIDWGCTHVDLSHLSLHEKINVYLVKVEDLNKLAMSMSADIMDKSWMYKLNPDMQLSYRSSALETMAVLLKIFSNSQDNAGKLTESFGESLITMASSRLLEFLLQHHRLPLAEIWKPQKKQNEGFDFHTVCSESLINFGEAKYSGKDNPHHNSIFQIDEFIEKEKHFRDLIHLEKLAPGNPYNNLANEKYGVVASFSINGKNKHSILQNAVSNAIEMKMYGNVERVYLIGVCHAI